MVDGSGRDCLADNNIEHGPSSHPLNTTTIPELTLHRLYTASQLNIQPKRSQCRAQTTIMEVGTLLSSSGCSKLLVVKFLCRDDGMAQSKKPMPLIYDGESSLSQC